MEAVWKLRVGAEAYYLQQVARGLEEYYTGAGEAPGYWTGGGVAALGLTGEVDSTDLRAVLAGLAPGTALSPTPIQANVCVLASATRLRSARKDCRPRSC